MLESLDRFRIWPRILARLRSGPPGPHLDAFVDALLAEGYPPDTLRRCARDCLERQFDAAIPDWSVVSADNIGDFVQMNAARLRPSACRAPATAIRAMLRFLAITSSVRPGLDGAVPPVRQWKHAALPRHMELAD